MVTHRNALICKMDWGIQFEWQELQHGIFQMKRAIRMHMFEEKFFKKRINTLKNQMELLKFKLAQTEETDNESDDEVLCVAIITRT